MALLSGKNTTNLRRHLKAHKPAINAIANSKFLLTNHIWQTKHVNLCLGQVQVNFFGPTSVTFFGPVAQCASRVAAVTFTVCNFIYIFGKATWNYA